MWNINSIILINKDILFHMEDLRRALKIEYTPSKASPELNMSFGGGVEPSIGTLLRRCTMNNYVQTQHGMKLWNKVVIPGGCL